MSFSASLREFQTLSAQQWLDRASRTLPQALTVVLVIAIAWQLVQLTWLLLERRAPVDAGDLVMAPPPATATRKGIDVQAIVDRASVRCAAGRDRQPRKMRQPTQMNLVLSRCSPRTIPPRAWRSSASRAQSAKVYAVGATVRPGTRLHSVYLDRVILDRNGQLETLALPKPSTAGIAITRPRRRAAAGGNQFADNLRRIAETNPTRVRRSRAPAAGVRQRRAARLSRLPRPQPAAVREARPAAGRPGAVDQRHAARRPAARHGDLQHDRHFRSRHR